jgi:hypothetical protein
MTRVESIMGIFRQKIIFFAKIQVLIVRKAIRRMINNLEV